MKVLLPAVGVSIAALVLVWPNLHSMGERFQLGFAHLSGMAVESLTMVNARYFGVDANNQPFTITADTAREVKPGSQTLDLTSPKADMTLKDGSWLVLGAQTGYYEHQRGLLDLVGDVNLFQDGGYELHTTRAQIDLRAGTASGDEPVNGQGPFGTIRSEGFRVSENGKRVDFTGKARLVLVSQAKGGRS